MKSYCKFMEGLPLLLKIILALPVFDGIIYGIYRICKGKLLWGIIWIFLGIAVVGAIIDIISLLQHKKVVYFA